MNDRTAGYRQLRASLAAFYAEAEPHAIHQQCHNLAWAHLAAMAANRIARAALRSRQPSLFQNPLLQDFLWTHALTPQFLAIARLIDEHKDVISVGRLFGDLRASREIITREAYVTSDGIPYDADAAARAILAAGHRGWKDDAGFWFFFADPSEIGLPDPRASQIRHLRFDVWTETFATSRSRHDLIRPGVFQSLDRQLKALRSSDVKRARDKFMAHAADAHSRSPDAPKRPGPRVSEIGLSDLRPQIGSIFAIARILGDMLLADWKSGPLGGLSDTARYEAGLLAAPMSRAEVEQIGRLPQRVNRYAFLP